MEFLYPQFLVALALVAIPIIIHLFNFRKFKTVAFSNVAFLKSIKEKTKSQSQLRHLLILLSRILTIAFIVLAFAQPYLPTGKSDKTANKQAVSIYVDNSFSMDAENESGRLLQLAKQQATAIVEAYSDNDELYFIDNRQKPIHQRALSKEEITNEINQIESESQTPTLNQLFKRQKNTLENSTADKKDIFIISDFQKSSSDLNIQATDSVYDIHLIKVQPYQKGNLYIDSCWMINPNPQKQSNIALFVRIKGHNIKEREVTLTLTVGQQQKAIANTSISDQATVSLNFNVDQNGWHNAALSLQDHPITFDDTYHFSFEIKPQLNVQHLYENNPHSSLKKLFDKDNYFSYGAQEVSRLNFSDIGQSQLIILDGITHLSAGLCDYLKKGLSNGQSIVLFPPAELDFDSYKAFCTSLSIDYYQRLDSSPNQLAQIAFEHILFDGVFESQDERINFPKVERYFQLSQLNNTNGQSLLSFVNNDSFLKEYSYGQGRIYLSSIGLENGFSDFSQHALFVPILYNMASYAGGKQQMAYTIGKQSIPFISTSTDVPFKLKQTEFECIPNLRDNALFIGDQIKSAGHYNLYDSKDKLLAQLAFNYDRKESDLKTIDNSQITQWSNRFDNIQIVEKDSEQLSAYLDQLNNGKPLWIYCIMLSLLFICFETLLIRLL